jgi:hypothetical protein
VRGTAGAAPQEREAPVVPQGMQPALSNGAAPDAPHENTLDASAPKPDATTLTDRTPVRPSRPDAAPPRTQGRGPRTSRHGPGDSDTLKNPTTLVVRR